jgi:cysteine synthase B
MEQGMNVISRIDVTILEAIGKTPLLRLHKVTKHINKKVEIYAKLEKYNPGGSVKDRAAYQMIRDAEETGLLTKDKIVLDSILDSTSGNTGIAYAMIGAVKGYGVKIVLPRNASTERKKIISAFGAEIVYSSEFEGSDGAIRMAREIYNENPDLYYMPDQYNNPSNWKAHYLTTGPEIIEQTKGRITHLISSIGTSNPDIRVISIQPDDAMHGIEGLKHMESSIVPGIYDSSYPDETGHSSGAALAGALEIAGKIKEGVIVIIFPDGGDRYLSHEI